MQNFGGEILSLNRGLSQNCGFNLDRKNREKS